MKLRRTVIVASALAASFAFTNAVRAQVVVPSRPTAPQVGEGMEAPDFNVVALDGKQIWLADYRGKLVLLVFWSTG